MGTGFICRKLGERPKHLESTMSENILRRIKEYKPMGAKLLGAHRRITLGKDLSGGIAVLIEGQDTIVIPPQEVVRICIDMLGMVGVRVELNPQHGVVHASA